MKKIFDWLREQIEGLRNAEADYYYASSNDVIDREDALELINEAEAKWEAEVCEWFKYDFRTIAPRNHDVENPYWRIPENMDKLKYCPFCGKPIKISEVE